MTSKQGGLLNYAKQTRNDEFYTQRCDIEKELKYYLHYLNNKIIYCNCDNIVTSNFVKYFRDNFKSIGLKKLIVTYYDVMSKPFKLEISKTEEKITTLVGNGDFRSEECTSILKGVDIVVTNPPYSLFNEYLKQLYHYNKNFIIIGNINALSLNYIFNKIKTNELKVGLNNVRFFLTPNGEKYEAARSIWYLNFNFEDIEKKQLILTKKYNEITYERYDEYEAINIEKVKDIPIDYKGLMGVPITFLSVFNHQQFKIIEKITPHINGKKKYQRIIIQKL